MRQIDDAFLREYVPEAEKAALDGLPPEEAHVFSRRFQRKMQALLRYERRTPFARGAAAVGRVVAAAVLALVILNAALFGGVKAYRERVYEIIETVTRKFTAFSVKVNENKAPPAEFKPIEPPYVPEGYEVVEHITNDIENSILYSKGDKNFFFSQIVAGGAPLHLDTENALVEVKEIFGFEGRVISKNEMTQAYFVAGGYEFFVSGNAGYEVIMEITENILEIFEK